jgi:hypothetical protein
VEVSENVGTTAASGTKHFLNLKMPTNFELTDAIINATTTTNETNMLDRWVPDEDWVRSFRNQPGFKYVTPG